VVACIQIVHENGLRILSKKNTMTAIPQRLVSNKQFFLLEVNANKWLEALEFNEIELKVCTHNLEKIITELKQHPKALPLAEHFQNQFLLQQENINKLKLEIRRFRRWIKGISSPVEMHKSNKHYHIAEDHFNSFSYFFDELIQEFKVFYRHEFFITHFVF
jgi:hypothetical protein